MVKKNTCHTSHASHNSQSGYEKYGVLKETNRKTCKSDNEQGDILYKCFIMIGNICYIHKDITQTYLLSTKVKCRKITMKDSMLYMSA